MIGTANPRLFAGLLAFVAVICLGCGDDDRGADSQNRPPVIRSLIAEPDTVHVGEPTTVTVTADDPDGDALNYRWDARLLEAWGGQGQSLQFESCCEVEEPTTGVVFSIVDDGRGGEARDSVCVIILPRAK